MYMGVHTFWQWNGEEITDLNENRSRWNKMIIEQIEPSEEI